MESGQNKLLTIAIPTWNRADKLKAALSFLLPQIYQNKEYIEFIISDNASTDNTDEVVANINYLYPDLTYKYNKQTENTGFFGNFQKCISLGTGKYFWLLSDDDYVLPGVLTEIINLIIQNKVGAIFLNDWTNDINNKQKFKTDIVNQNQFFNDRSFRHSLISSVIYMHNVQKDDSIFTELNGNSLIGYAVFLKAIYSFNEFAILYGSSLLAKNDYDIRFNALEIFTVDLSKCIKNSKFFYSNSIISNITNSFLKNNIYGAYKNYKFFKIYTDTKFKFLEIFSSYICYLNFWIYIIPLCLFPVKLFHLQQKIRGIKN